MLGKLHLLVLGSGVYLGGDFPELHLELPERILGHLEALGERLRRRFRKRLLHVVGGRRVALLLECDVRQV
jgi:hypothetical protein